MTDHDAPTPDTDDGPSFPKWLKWGLIGALAVLVLGYGAIFLYANVIKDSPDELDEDDLAAALAVDDTTPDAPVETTPEPSADDAPATTDSPATTDAPATTEAPAEAPAAIGPGEWVVTDASTFGYRVDEVLFGVDTAAVGRSNQIAGGLLIEGTTVIEAEFIVDVASIESDDGRRDSQFRGRIMSTDEFPEATFVLTVPIELGVDVAEGAQVETSATGDLTLRGVTNNVHTALIDCLNRLSKCLIKIAINHNSHYVWERGE